MKRFLAIILALILVLAGCGAEADNAIYESAEGTFNTQVTKKQILLERTPANNETVSLINDALTYFLKEHQLGKGLSVAGNEIAAQQGVKLTWSCNTENSGYTVIYTTKQDFSDSISVDTAEPELILEDLYVATAYYWQVVTHTADGDNYSTVFSFKTAETPRIISIDGVTNTRDVGGYLTVDGKYRFKQGMIFRGAKLDGITQAGIDKALNVYKIKTDLDLRRTTDYGYSDITPLGDPVEHINISVIDYTGAFSHKEEMRQAIALCAKEEMYPMYVHCSAGRDRTGTMLFILGALLGINDEALYADYEITYLSENAYKSGDLTGHESFLKFMELFNAYEGNTIQEKAVSYCKDIGVTDEEIRLIRQILLEEVK